MLNMTVKDKKIEITQLKKDIIECEDALINDDHCPLKINCKKYVNFKAKAKKD